MYAKQGKKKSISSSGGNAGISVDYMGNKLNIPVAVFVPKMTSTKAIELMRSKNAKVIIHEDSCVEANDLALSHVNSDAVYIHPFDHQSLQDGVANIINEVVEDRIKPDAVILSVSGGNILSGISQSLKNNLIDILIYAVET